MSTDPGMSDEAVRKATERDWKEWRSWLDERGGQDLSHKEIVALLRAEGGVSSGWWAQAVTVGYEKLTGRRIVGETRDTGFQVGTQRTLPLGHDRAWRLLTSREGLRAWLQARVEGKGDRTVVGFHEEHLPGPEERERRRAHFRAALDSLGRMA